MKMCIYVEKREKSKQTTASRRKLLNLKAFLRERKVDLLFVGTFPLQRRGAWEKARFSYFLPVEGYPGTVSWKDLASRQDEVSCCTSKGRRRTGREEAGPARRRVTAGGIPRRQYQVPGRRDRDNRDDRQK